MGWKPLSFSSFTPRPRPSFFRGEPSLCFYERKDAKCLPSDGEGSVVDVSIQTKSIIFPVKPGPQSEERASVGALQQRRKMDSVGLFGRGCAFLARWMAPSALAVMQHNAAASQPPLVLAAGAWHGHSAPAAPALPHPGPGLPLAEAGSCFYLVMLAASAGCGVRRTRSPSREVGGGWFGVTPPAPPVGQCSDEGASCSAKGAGLRLRTGI